MDRLIDEWKNAGVSFSSSGIVTVTLDIAEARQLASRLGRNDRLGKALTEIAESCARFQERASQKDAT